MIIAVGSSLVSGAAAPGLMPLPQNCRILLYIENLLDQYFVLGYLNTNTKGSSLFHLIFFYLQIFHTSRAKKTFDLLRRGAAVFI